MSRIRMGTRPPHLGALGHTCPHEEACLARFQWVEKAGYSKGHQTDAQKLSL